ncbi:MAG: hypothetical protein PVG93_03665 [Phycisphaerales bacterium]
MLRLLTLSMFVISLWCPSVSAVTSRIIHHSTGADFVQGDANDVVISSKGTLGLGQAWKRLTDDFEDVWSINSIVLNGGKVFIGTSPNGGVYEYSLGKLTEIYSAKPSEEDEETQEDEEDNGKTNNVNDTNEQSDANAVKSERRLANEHIFAMANDIMGRLLVGISGKRCVLCRLKSGQLQTVFEPNDAKYIFAITLDELGNIYLGTGPEGKIYRLNSSCSETELFYDSTDKNILSLASADDGSILAGSDTRGLVYKIDRKTKNAKVLYDAQQQEITALLLTEQGDIYATATSAQTVEAQKKFARQLPSAGRPEAESEQEKSSSDGSSTKLKIANTSKNTKNNNSDGKKSRRKPPKPGQASYVYKITKDGFVTEVFSQAVVLFALAQQQDKLLLGTGNEGELFTIEPATEQEAVVFKDEQASQITAISVVGGEVYLGTANPAKLIKLQKTFVLEGTYNSSLVDAGQPANWGKLQIEADIPKNARVLVSSRSGNVEDVNDPTFSDWTEPIEIKKPLQLRCPLGRYCQYKLTLQSPDGVATPVVREVAVASTVPNLAPKVEEVTAERIDKPEKAGIFNINYKAKDENNDTLVYKVDFRKVGRQNWIELEDKTEAQQFEWDGRTVEDGRYEIRVTANDEKSNSEATKLTGSRISEAVVIDNTGPSVEVRSIENAGKIIKTKPAEVKSGKVTIQIAVIDIFSAISSLQYTVDSNTDWLSAVPDDLVYDTTNETVTIALEELGTGEHVLAVKASDDVGNVTYKTIELLVKGN